MEKRDKYVGVALDPEVLRKFDEARRWQEEHKHSAGSYDDKDNQVMAKVLDLETGEVKWIPLSDCEFLDGVVVEPEQAEAIREAVDDAKSI